MTDPATLYVLVGKRVREAREKRGLTQRALGSLVSLTRTSITNIERGRQKMLLHTLVDLARALNVPPAELLAGTAGMPDDPGEWDELLKGRPRIEREWIRSALDPKGKGR